MLQLVSLAIMLGLGTAASVRAAEPTLFTAYVPSAQNTGGAVVIVSPADATPLARWFNDRGLAAFTLLRPRPPPTPRSPSARSAPAPPTTQSLRRVSLSSASAAVPISLPTSPTTPHPKLVPLSSA